jgi:transposase
VLTAKYCEHLPLYRQTEILARRGGADRALLSNWVDTCCRLMAPLDEALYHYVMNCRKLHTDELGAGAGAGQKDENRAYLDVCPG